MNNNNNKNMSVSFYARQMEHDEGHCTVTFTVKNTEELRWIL